MSSDPSVKPILLTLPGVTPPLAVEAIPYGLTLHKLLVNGDGKTHDLLIGPQEVADHKRDRTFLNTVVGRYSNRLPAGEFDLEKDGIKSKLNIVGTESPTVQLHGGADSFDRQTWNVISTAESKLFSPAERVAIDKLPSSTIFTLTSPDGDQGFPGQLYTEVLLALTEPSQEGQGELGSLILVYRATVDGANGQKTVTPINLTQHWGFNLDASLDGSVPRPTPDVLAHKLTIKADNTLELDEVHLATGQLNPTSGTDHEHGDKLIGKGYPNPGYDHFYLFPKKDKVPIHVPLSSLESLDVITPLLSSGSDVPVVLSSDQSGIKLSFETNQPGVQFYTGIGLSKNGPRKRIHGGSGEHGAQGDGYHPDRGAFLEFHEPLAAWLHPWGQDRNDTLLTSDLLYNNYTKLTVHFTPVA